MPDDAKPALTPTRRFPEFRGSEGWKEKPLHAAADINPAHGGLPESFVYIDLESVEAGQLKAKTRVSRTDAPSRAQRLLHPSDIIFQIVRPYQRNNLLCEFDDGEAYVASTGYAQLRPKVDTRFLYQSIHTDSFVGKVVAKCTGSSYPAINSADLAEIELPLPPSRAEQQKIAECLSTLDELIVAISQKLDALKAHKKGLMQQLFPREGETLPRLRFPEFQDAWAESTLGALSASISSGRDEKAPDGRFDLYGSTGVIGKTSVDTFVGTFLLVARVGANAGYLAKTSGSFGVTDNTLVIDLIDKKNNDFIFYWLGSIGLNKMIFGSGQPLITGGQLKVLPILLPCESERERISSCLSSLDDLIAAQSDKLEALKTHKKGLMQQLFPSPAADGT